MLFGIMILMMVGLKLDSKGALFSATMSMFMLILIFVVDLSVIVFYASLILWVFVLAFTALIS